MNKDQRKMVDIAIETHRRALQVLQDDKAMEGFFESLAEVQRGERGTRLKDIKRKSPRARRVSS